MLIAIVSDIHANLEALQAVIRHARSLDSQTEFWCLGDVFDRGPSPFVVWDELERQVMPTCWLAGNHDWGLFKLLSQEYFPHDYDRRSQKIQRSELQAQGKFEEICQAVSALPVMCSPMDGVYMAHASFGVPLPDEAKHRLTRLDCVGADERHYLFAPVRADKSLKSLSDFVLKPFSDSLMIKKTEHWSSPRLLLVGHTHLRALFSLGKPAHELDFRLGEWMDLVLDEEKPILINPGSVGFSRNVGDDYASYALLDLQGYVARVRFERVSYNIEATIKKLKDFYYPPKIIQMLERHSTGSDLP